VKCAGPTYGEKIVNVVQSQKRNCVPFYVNIAIAVHRKV